MIGEDKDKRIYGNINHVSELYVVFNAVTFKNIFSIPPG
jgi:hypothetical protein